MSDAHEFVVQALTAEIADLRDALARVKRERDEAIQLYEQMNIERMDAAAERDALREAVDDARYKCERCQDTGDLPSSRCPDCLLGQALADVDALRAKMEALTGEQAVEAVARALAGEPYCYCPDDWRQPYDESCCPKHGSAPWPEEPEYVKARNALAAARDAAAAKEPWCTCGAKTPQGEYHDVGCPAREIDD